MTTDKEAERMAAGLTEAQRSSILRAREDIDGIFWFARGAARGVPAELKLRTIDGHCLSPLGLRVRTILQKGDAQ